MMYSIERFNLVFATLVQEFLELLPPEGASGRRKDLLIQAPHRQTRARARTHPLPTRARTPN